MLCTCSGRSVYKDFCFISKMHVEINLKPLMLLALKSVCLGIMCLSLFKQTNTTVIKIIFLCSFVCFTELSCSQL